MPDDRDAGELVDRRGGCGMILGGMLRWIGVEASPVVVKQGPAVRRALEWYFICIASAFKGSLHAEGEGDERKARASFKIPRIEGCTRLDAK